jgi:cob(I)alamin adenosyltransferase
MSEDKKEVTFDRMPGSDPIEDAQESKIDLNFGLGEEPKAELPAEEPEPAAEPATEAPTAEVKAEEKPEIPEAPEVPEPVVQAEAKEEPKITQETEQKKPMVPKSRLDEVLAKQKALQKQLDDLMAAKTAAETAPESFDFASKEVQYQNFVLDGEHDKAAALRQEIRRAERAQLEYELTQKMEQKVTQSQQMSALQQAAAELETNFPVFDRASSDFNEQYTQEVIDLRDAFIVKGENPVAALSKAAKFVIREYGLDPGAPVEPSLSVSTPTSTKVVDEVAKKRAEISRKLKAADAQPPTMPGESSAARGEKLVDLSSMSEDEFNALPAATLKRLRGDII